MRNIIKQIEDDKIVLQVNLDVYNQEVLTAAIYKFTESCYIFQEKEGALINVYFQLKPEKEKALDYLAKEFCNELIDQQVRFDTYKRYNNIREVIVEKAFSPINK
jgi:His-Xaa-Ser system protein HxsD